MKSLRPADQFSRVVGATPEVIEHGLVRGATYRVKKEFIDFAGDVHPVDEQWMFVGVLDLYRDNILKLYVRLNWRAYELSLPYGTKHDAMTGHLDDYLQRIDKPQEDYWLRFKDE